MSTDSGGIIIEDSPSSVLQYPFWLFSQVKRLICDIGKILFDLFSLIWAWRGLVLVFVLFWGASYLINSQSGLIMSQIEHYNRCYVWPQWVKFYRPMVNSIARIYNAVICWTNMMGQINRLLNTQLFIQTYEHCHNGFDLFHWFESLANVVLLVIQNVFIWAFAADPFEVTLPAYEPIHVLLMEVIPETALGVTCMCQDMFLPTVLVSRVLQNDYLSCASHQALNVLVEYWQIWVNFYFDLITLVRDVLFGGGTTPDVKDILKGQVPGDTVIIALSAATMLERVNSISIYLCLFVDNTFTRVYCTITAELDAMGDDSLNEGLYQTCISLSENNPELFISLAGFIAVGTRTLRLTTLLLWHLPQLFDEALNQPAGPRWMIDTWYYKDWAIVFDSIRTRPPRYNYTASINSPGLVTVPGGLTPTTIDWPDTYLYGPAEKPDCNSFNVSHDIVPCDQCPVIADVPLTAYLCRTAASLDNITQPVINMTLWKPILCDGVGGGLTVIADLSNFVIGFIVHLFNWDRLGVFLADQNHYDIIFNSLVGAPMTMGGVLNAVNTLAIGIDTRLEALSGIITTIAKCGGEAIRSAFIAPVRLINTIVGTGEPGFDAYVCITDTVNCVILERSLMWIRRPRMNDIIYDPTYSYVNIEPFAPKAFLDWLCYWLDNQALEAFTSDPTQVLPDICCFVNYLVRAVVEYYKASATLLIADYETFRIFIDPSANFESIFIKWAACTDLATCNNIAAFISDLEDLLNCPCLLIFEIEALGTFGKDQFNCVCDALGPAVRTIAALARSASTFISVAARVIYCAEMNFPEPECSDTLALQMEGAFNRLYDSLQALAETGGGLGCFMGIPWVLIGVDCLGVAYTWPQNYPPCNSSHNRWGSNIPCAMPDRLQMLVYLGAKVITTVLDFVISRVQSVLDTGLKVLLPGHQPLEGGSLASCLVIENFLLDVSVALFGISDQLVSTSTNARPTEVQVDPAFNSTTTLDAILLRTGQNVTEFYLLNPNATLNPYPYINQYLNFTPPPSSTVYSSEINFTALANVSRTAGFIQALALTIDCILGPPTSNCLGNPIFAATPKAGGELTSFCFGTLLGVGGYDFSDFFPLLIAIANDLCTMMSALLNVDAGGFLNGLISFVMNCFEFLGAFLGSTTGIIAGVAALVQVMSGYLYGEVIQILFDFGQTVLAGIVVQYQFSTVWESFVAYFGFKRDYGDDMNQVFVDSLTEGTWCKNATQILIKYDRLYLANELIWYGCFYAAAAPILIRDLTKGKLELPLDIFYNKDTFFPIMENLLNLLSSYFAHRSGMSLDKFITQIIEVPQDLLSYAEAQLALQELNAGITDEQLKTYAIILNMPNLTAGQLMEKALAELQTSNLRKRSHVFQTTDPTTTPSDFPNIFDILYPHFKHPYKYQSRFRTQDVSFGKSLTDYMTADMKNDNPHHLDFEDFLSSAGRSGGEFNLGTSSFLPHNNKLLWSSFFDINGDHQTDGNNFCDVSSDGSKCTVDVHKLYPGITLRLHENDPEPILVGYDKKRGFIDAAFGTALSDNIDYDAHRDPKSPQFNPFYQTNINLFTSLQGGLVLNISGLDRLLPVINGKIAMSYENITFWEYMQLRGWNSSVYTYFISTYEGFELSHVQDELLKTDAYMSHFVKIVENYTETGEQSLGSSNSSQDASTTFTDDMYSYTSSDGGTKRNSMEKRIFQMWENTKSLVKNNTNSGKSQTSPEGSIEWRYEKQFKSQKKSIYFRLNSEISIEMQKKLAAIFAMSGLQESLVQRGKYPDSSNKDTRGIVEIFWDAMISTTKAYQKFYTAYGKTTDKVQLHVLSYQGSNGHKPGMRMEVVGDDFDGEGKIPYLGENRVFKKKRVGPIEPLVDQMIETYKSGLSAHYNADITHQERMVASSKYYFIKHYFLEIVPNTLAHVIRTASSYSGYYSNLANNNPGISSSTTSTTVKRTITEAARVETKPLMEYDPHTPNEVRSIDNVFLEVGKTIMKDNWGNVYTPEDEVYVIHNPLGKYATYKTAKVRPMKLFGNPLESTDRSKEEEEQSSLFRLYYAHPDDAIDHHLEVNSPSGHTPHEVDDWKTNLNRRSLVYEIELNYYELHYMTVETKKKCVNNWLWNEHHLYDLTHPDAPSTIISDSELLRWQEKQQVMINSSYFSVGGFSPKEAVLTLHKCYRQKSTLPIHPHQEKYGHILKGESIYYHRWGMIKNTLATIWNDTKNKLDPVNIRRKFTEVYVNPLLNKYRRYVEVTGKRPAVTTPMVAYEKTRSHLLGKDNKRFAIPEVFWVELGHPITFYRPDGLPMDTLTHSLMREQWLKEAWKDFYASGKNPPSISLDTTKKRSNFPPLINMCLPSNVPEQTCRKCKECIRQDALTDAHCSACNYCKGCVQNPTNISAGAICSSCGVCSVADSTYCTGVCTGCTDCVFGDVVCLDCLIIEVLLTAAVEAVEFCYRWKILNDTSVIRVPPPNSSLFEIVYLDGYTDSNGVVTTGGTTFPNFSDYGFVGIPMYLGDLFIYGFGVLCGGWDLIKMFIRFCTNLNDDPALGQPVGLYFWIRNLPIPWIGWCRRDLNDMCTYGMGLPAALKLTLILAAILALLIFLQFSFPAAILLTTLLGPGVFLKTVAWIAWLWNPICANAPTFGIFSLLGFPWLVWPQLPVCAVDEIRDLLNSLILQYTDFIPPEFYVTAAGTFPTTCRDYIVPPNCTSYGFTSDATTVGYLGQRYFPPSVHYWLVDYLNTTCLVRGQCTAVFGLQMPLLFIILVGLGLSWILGAGVVMGLSITLVVGYSLSGVCEGILSPFFAVNFQSNILNNPALMDSCFHTQIPSMLLLAFYLFIFLVIIIIALLMIGVVYRFLLRILTAPPFSWITPQSLKIKRQPTL